MATARGDVICHGGKGWWQVCEVTGHFTPIVRKQRTGRKRIQTNFKALVAHFIKVPEPSITAPPSAD